MIIKTRTIPHIFRSKYMRGTTSTTITQKGKGDSTISPNDWFYKDTEGRVHSKYPLVGDSEITAFGMGKDTEGRVIVYDGLDSFDTTIALSANQGRILRDMIKAGGGGGGADLTNYYTRYETDQKIAALVNGAPETMDTLKELSDAIKNNGDAVSAINASISQKANKDGSNASGTWGISVTGSSKGLNDGKTVWQIDTNIVSSADNVVTLSAGKITQVAAKTLKVSEARRSKALEVLDNRDILDKPNSKDQGLYCDFKKNNDQLKDGGNYYSVLTIRGYGKSDDFTGNWPCQLAFTDNSNVLYRRAANGTTWQGWRKIWNSGNFNPDDKVNRVGRYSVYTDDKKPYEYIHLFRVANKGNWTVLRLDIDIKLRYESAELYLDLFCNEKAFGNATYYKTNQFCHNNRKADIYIKKTEQTAGYNYYDIYISSKAWDKGYYDIVNQGGNGEMFFEHYGKRLSALPPGCIKIQENFNLRGNFTATGEITAYSTASAANEGIETLDLTPAEEERTIIFDGLTSSDTKVALSANQGRILRDEIQRLKDEIENLKKQMK